MKPLELPPPVALFRFVERMRARLRFMTFPVVLALSTFSAAVLITT